ncbi:DUF3761 domain-containing protein [Amycolatopsis sp. FU40]|uniref:DUF3761 domain-containing protein n=1 Tax=Amycolatopsis sp. FU40 TaxID=2914159 RepID=UPI001F22024A|nr:DUF3761 domain-containing protein [Amycolatopsis sp. FU40]UKD51878.1 DUF3761 domain-containing protein [Amycolatopsis sp. FU40]
MWRKLGMALAAGVLAAGCGAATAPAEDPASVVPSDYSPSTTYSEPDTYSETSTTSVTSPETTQQQFAPPTTAAKPKAAPKTPAAPEIQAPTFDVPTFEVPTFQVPDQAAPPYQAAPSAQPTTPDPVPADCGPGYYRNSSGTCVHNPSSNPSGATALCNDGTYSYSQHRSGTCSGHGGVKQWL